MKPACKLSKTWPSIKPKGCKLRPTNDKRKQKKAAPSRAAPSTKTSESVGEKSLPNKPRRITPVAVASAPSSQSTMTSFSAPTQESAGRNSSKIRIEAMVDRRIKSFNRQPTLKKGWKTIKRMTRVFGGRS